jgi:hypothetical protein
VPIATPHSGAVVELEPGSLLLLESTLVVELVPSVVLALVDVPSLVTNTVVPASDVPAPAWHVPSAPQCCPASQCASIVQGRPSVSGTRHAGVAASTNASIALRIVSAMLAGDQSSPHHAL